MAEALFPACDEDLVNDLAVCNEVLLEQAVTHMVQHEVQSGSLSAREVVTGLCRIGTLSLVVSILTGMKEPGMVIAVLGVVWLYSHL
ncbi:MAG TPA: hypothetical protein VHO69_16200 [Phototrophicaceae bacterium]|nr:hypothetical protein [Phototrophicaceae bacterium]